MKYKLDKPLHEILMKSRKLARRHKGIRWVTIFNFHCLNPFEFNSQENKTQLCREEGKVERYCNIPEGLVIVSFNEFTQYNK